MFGEYFKFELTFKNYIQIAEAYHKVFNEYYHMEKSFEEQVEFQNYLTFCSIALPAFEKFEKVCKATVDSYERINFSQGTLIVNLNAVNSFCSKNYGSKDMKINEREAICNSFLIMLDWARGEILDLKAMLEGLQKHLNFQKQIEYYQKKLEKRSQKLEQLKQGKKSISTIFSTKSSDNQKKVEKTKVEHLEFELKGIETIEIINSVRLLRSELPLFKKLKVQSLSALLKLFCESIHSEFDKYRKQTQTIEETLGNNIE